jgi:hypothetical protein
MMSLDYSLVVAETKYDMKRSQFPCILCIYFFNGFSPKTGQSRKNISLSDLCLNPSLRSKLC